MPRGAVKEAADHRNGLENSADVPHLEQMPIINVLSDLVINKFKARFD